MSPKQFLSATHVVVADPVQFHLRPEDQRVVGILGEDILSGKGIGASFERLPYEFSLDNNVQKNFLAFPEKNSLSHTEVIMPYRYLLRTFLLLRISLRFVSILGNSLRASNLALQ